MVGPLGQPTHVEKVGHVVCIGGGVGIAPVYPIICAMKAAGNRGDEHHQRALEGPADPRRGHAQPLRRVEGRHR